MREDTFKNASVKWRRFTPNLLAAAIISSVSGFASAQIEEITVTAKQRSEKLQDVPLAIDAFTASDLRENQITGLKDLQDVTPNLYLSSANRNDPTAVGMRGLTPNTSDERYQGVSFFLDGVPLSGQLASLDLNGIERVEVIKGPQAASFGRATYSGAINFITKSPAEDTITGSIRARGGYPDGGDSSTYMFSGSVDMPLVEDKLWLSLAGSTFQNGAVGESPDDGSPIGEEQTQSGTATLYYEPTDTLSIKLRGLYSHDEDSGSLAVIQHPRDWVEAGVDTFTLSRADGSFYPTTLPDADVGLISNVGSTGTERDRYFGSLIVTKDIGDYELTYSGGYFYSEDDRDAAFVGRAYGVGEDPVFGDLVGTDAVDLSFYAGFLYPSQEFFENTSHQIVLLSPSEAAFRWRAGVSYFWEEDETRFLLSASDTNPSGRSRLDRLENISTFGGFDYDLSDTLTLSVEGRVANERISYVGCPNCASPIDKGQANKSTDFSPRVTLSYKPSDDSMLYALCSSGVKSARMSRVVVNGDPTIMVADPEELSNYELGSKNTFLEGRLKLNAAVFFQDVENQQLVSSSNVNIDGEVVPLTFADNVGESEVYGFELDTEFLATDALTLRASVGYAHHEFVNDDPLILSADSTWSFEGEVGDPVSLDGLTQTNVPRWTGRVSGEYFIPSVIHAMDMTLRLDASYKGKWYADLANRVEAEDAWTANARVSLRNQSFEVAAYGKNIFNQDRAIGSGLAGGAGLCAFVETDTAFYGNNQQCLQASAPRPAEFGVEVNYDF